MEAETVSGDLQTVEVVFGLTVRETSVGRACVGRAGRRAIPAEGFDEIEGCCGAVKEGTLEPALGQLVFGLRITDDTATDAHAQTRLVQGHGADRDAEHGGAIRRSETDGAAVDAARLIFKAVDDLEGAGAWERPSWSRGEEARAERRPA